MISDLFKTKCPHCGGKIYPQYFRDTQTRKCEKCQGDVIINLRAKYFANMFFLVCLLFVGPVLVHLFDRGVWIYFLAIIVGLIGYAKFTNYSKNAKLTDL